MVKKVSPELLQTVAYDNIRNNQIGGQTDGVNWDVGRDMGFVRPEDIQGVIAAVEATKDTKTTPVVVETATNEDIGWDTTKPVVNQITVEDQRKTSDERAEGLVRAQKARETIERLRAEAAATQAESPKV